MATSTLQKLSEIDNPGQVVLFKAVIAVDITQEFVNDIIVGAFEGGINYWCNDATLRKGIRPEDPMSPFFYTPEDFEWDLKDIDTGKHFKSETGMKYRTLTAKTFKKGLQLFLKNGGPSGGDDISDAGNYDAGDSDQIVQYACFGEVVFG